MTSRQCIESYTETLAQLIATQVRQLSTSPKSIRVVGFCTRTGCIPLLLLSILSKSLPNIYLDITGVDISPVALALAKRNYTHNLSQYRDTSQHKVDFVYSDLLDPLSTIKGEAGARDGMKEGDTYMIVVSNPPYISKAGFE